VFDLMMLDGVDLRAQPWRERRAELQRIFRRSRSGLVLSKAIVGRGHDVYAAACHMGLEGIVSKRIDAPYRSGKSTAWLIIKDPAAPGDAVYGTQRGGRWFGSRVISDPSLDLSLGSRGDRPHTGSGKWGTKPKRPTIACMELANQPA
jgi:ATP-dependent DNA ligase